MEPTERLPPERQVAEEEDWSRMMSEFQAVEGPSDDLVKSVEKGRRRLVRRFIGSLLAATFTSSVGIWMLATHRDLPSVVFAVMQMGIPLWLVSFVWRSMRKSWGPTAHTTRAFLEVELERQRDKVRRMKFLRNRVLPILVLVSLVWHGLLFIQNPALLHPSSWTAAIVGFGGPYVICAAMFWRAGKNRKKHELRAEAIAGRILELGEPEESKAIEI